MFALAFTHRLQTLHLEIRNEIQSDQRALCECKNVQQCAQPFGDILVHISTHILTHYVHTINPVWFFATFSSFGVCVCVCVWFLSECVSEALIWIAFDVEVIYIFWLDVCKTISVYSTLLYATIYTCLRYLFSEVRRNFFNNFGSSGVIYSCIAHNHQGWIYWYVNMLRDAENSEYDRLYGLGGERRGVGCVPIYAAEKHVVCALLKLHPNSRTHSCTLAIRIWSLLLLTSRRVRCSLMWRNVSLFVRYIEMRSRRHTANGEKQCDWHECEVCPDMWCGGQPTTTTILYRGQAHKRQLTKLCLLSRIDFVKSSATVCTVFKVDIDTQRNVIHL